MTDTTDDLSGAVVDTDPESVSPTGEQLVLTYLQDHEAECPVCGYNLRALTRNVCPECGNAFTLRVHSVHVPLGELLALVAPMIMMIGLALFILSLWIKQGPPAPTRILNAFYLFFAAAGLQLPIVVLMPRRRRKFYRRSRAKRWTAILLVWALNIAVVLLFFEMI